MSMERTYLYFQPEYVSKFKCDGAKCNARCCKGWSISIDKASYEKYSALADAQEIIPHINFNSEKKSYVMKLDEKNFCPMLTENNLCRLQRDYGEEFLSVTCSSYPRHTYNLGKFFERSLTMTCPVAAELILFQEQPIEFKLVEVPEKIHSNGGKIQIGTFLIPEKYLSVVFEIQLAMISILQERRFSIDQRLIVLGIFFDKLQDVFSDKDELLKLVTMYESEEFLMGEIAPLLRGFSLDAKNFIFLIVKFLDFAFDSLKSVEGEDFIKAFAEVLKIKPDEKSILNVAEAAAHYESLADEREKFLVKYSSLLENYLVNELFTYSYPWRFKKENMTRNFAVFLISYKIFELIIFSATQKGLDSKDDILKLVDWFTAKTNHNKTLYDRFFELLTGIDDIFLIMNCLLRG